ncbi:RPM1-interacting 4-like isoform X2 [Olea europaea subsp. europaea]|uniref:RPM1-interacting 4-like isoform X2 n=1 Tax=Olea europaea subsp. europaea TaxID=158383 RepID=A0A8S0QL82_OLEEU|nr:RPM1-interacting 4-like isoform X2 [Olea europaea subsp. europaea]
MQDPSVPKFGNWESEDNVPYTVYFDKARKNRGGKMINPNDPAENPDMFLNADSSPPAPAPAPPTKPETSLVQPRNSPAQSENTGQRTANDSNYVGRGARSGGHARRTAGSGHSIERSPLHPHHQAKITGRGSGSPAWEGKNSYDSSHGTPGRSRLKPTQGDESPDRGAAVPVFGEWENDPQSAENFTHIFNKVREERNNGAGNVSSTPKHPSQNHQSKNHKKCCFPWC